jgi:hypothetical protein
MSARIIARENPVLVALQQIAALNGGVLNPRMVIEAARDEGSVLHDHFEWDDTTAAEGFRLVQAGMLIRRVRLRIVTDDRDSRTVNIQVSRAFESLPSMRRRDGGYLALQTIVDDPVKKRELLDQVLTDLEALRRKYAYLEELSDVWEAIEIVKASKAIEGEVQISG